MWKLKSSVDICHACISIHYYSPDHVFMSQAKHIAGSVAGPLQIAVQSSDMLVYLDFTQYYRSLLMSCCWPKTTPIAAPIKSFAVKTTWAIVFAVLCILKLNGRKAWQDSFTRMSSYHHSLLREMISFPLKTNRTWRLTWSTIYSR